MLICVDCQRTNAPWAKKCAACAADLRTISPNTLICGFQGSAIDNQNLLVPDSPRAEIPAEIKTWSPDTEWHSLDEIDGEKVLDNETIEPISVIEPSRTAEIDWGRPKEDAAKFDSSPIHADSRNRFDEYGYDFERANKSAWKTTAILLSGIMGIIMAGGLAIGYLHSTTIPASQKLVDATKDNIDKTYSRATGIVAPAGGQQGHQSNNTAMTEEVISVTKPMSQELNQGNAEKQIIQLVTNSNNEKRAPTISKPPVFVMSASEPILAKPETGKIAASAKTPEIKNTPYPVLVPVPLGPTDTRTTQGASTGSAQNEPVPLTATAPMQALATPKPLRLKDKQSSDCSNSAFLGRVLCEERSRVDFCSNQWNAHPDCQLNNSKLEP